VNFAAVEFLSCECFSDDRKYFSAKMKRLLQFFVDVDFFYSCCLNFCRRWKLW